MERKKLILLLAVAVFIPWGGRAMIPRPEHPRPNFQRPFWQNLNGEWEFEFDPKDQGLRDYWFERGSLSGRIIVPYPVESELSGVAEKKPPAVCWYLKRFDLDSNLQGPDSRVVLHFGAVDYQAQVWLNGQKLGEHTGGYTPFAFDITGLVRPAGNRLVVRVYDSLDRMQVRGKQSPTGKPYMIMYTPVTGIWQTVWLERTGNPYIESFRFIPAKDLSGGNFKVEIAGAKKPIWAEIEISEMDNPGAGTQRVRVKDGTAIWFAPHPKPWSPDSPTLYRAVLILRDYSGLIVDQVESYVGIRTIEARDQRIWLNGRDFYQKLLLDQGYFPGGWYTPPDDAAMKADCEIYKRMGFNGLRKHQKIEDPRFLYWCDRLGLVVWEEMPSLGFGVPRRVPTEAMERFKEEWLAVISRDRNHPCIITWTIFNENWGIMEMLVRKEVRRWAQEMVRLTKEADPTRLVVDNSGGWHFATEVWDFHHYLNTSQKARRLYEKYNLSPGDHYGFSWYLLQGLAGSVLIPSFFPGVDYEGQPLLLSEYGGFGFYKTAGDLSLLDLYREYTLALDDYPHIVGYCYTQPYDVEQEQNGLMTFDRQLKIPVEEIKKINDAVGW